MRKQDPMADDDLVVNEDDYYNNEDFYAENSPKASKK